VDESAGASPDAAASAGRGKAQRPIKPVHFPVADARV
jgi:hypothetical protein